MFFEQGLRLLAGLFVGAWMARYLGPESYGLFSYALAYFLIFQAAAKLGLDDIIIKSLVENPKDRESILGTSFWLKLIASFVFIAFMLLAIFLNDEDPLMRLYVAIVSIGLIFRSFEVTDFYFRSQVQARFISICRIIQLSINSVVKISLIIFDADLIYFVMTILLENFMLGMLYYIAYRFQGHPSFLKKFDLSVAKKYIKYSYPLMISSTAVILYTRVDQLLISEFLDDAAVGIYAVSFRVTEVLYTIPIILSNSLFPAIVNAKSKGVEVYQSRLKRLYGFLILLSLSFGIIISFSGDWIINFLYGKDFAEAATILTIHAWTLVFVSLGTIGTSWYITEGLQKLELWRNIFGAIVNISFNLFLIPRYGVIGAAWASLSGYFASSLLFDLIHPKARASFKLKISAVINPYKVFFT